MERVVTLYKGERYSSEQREAINERPMLVIHLRNMENATRTLHIATYLDVRQESGLIQLEGREPVKLCVPTS